MRRNLAIVSGITAGCNAGVCVAGYYSLYHRDDYHNKSAGFTILIGTLTLMELALIVLYWTLVILITDKRNAALSVQFVSSPSLLRSPKTLIVCVLECLFHLFVPIPSFSLSQDSGFFGSEATLDLCCYMYICAMLRNYHLIRVLYWLSRFSSIRTLMYVRITTVSSFGTFILRSFLSAYKLPLVLGVYITAVVFGGVIHTTLEAKTEVHQDVSIWSGTWVVAYTQSNIGYGEESPVLFSTQFAIVLNVIVGFTLTGLLLNLLQHTVSLNLHEFQFCSNHISQRYKRKHLTIAVKTIQSWWRLIQSRMRKQPNGQIIVSFYSTLRKFRTVLVRCNTISAGLLQNHIANFGESVSLRVNKMSEYLYALRHVNDLVRVT